WSEQPRQLTSLEIHEGELMVLKQLTEKVDMIPVAKAATPEAPKPVDPEAVDPKTIVKTENGTPLPGVGDKTAQARKNLFDAKFTKNVKVYSGDRRLRGADDLTLTFQWEMKDGLSRKKKSKKPAMAGDQTPEEIETAKAEAAAEAAPKTPAEPDLLMGGSKKTDRLEIHWTGPLTISPVGHVDMPSRRDFKIRGTGKRVELSDAQARLVCREFEFVNPSQDARFWGDTTLPAQLYLLRGEKVSAKEIQFSRTKGIATLLGKGSMIRFDLGNEKDQPVTSFEELDAYLEALATVSENITWATKVDIHFDMKEIAGKDGKKRTRPFVKDAEFFDKVVLVQSPKSKNDAPAPPSAQRPDSVTCDRLKVWMKAADNGKVRIDKADAIGHVTAYQDGSEISAKTVAVTFKAQPNKTDTAKSAATAKKSPKGGMFAMGRSGKVRASRVVAEGDVQVKYFDPKDSTREPLEVQCDYLNADLLTQLAAVGGKIDSKTGKVLKMAQIIQGKNSITGGRIFFDQNGEAAKVEGPGILVFHTRQDLSGNTLKASRALKVTWQTSMIYHGNLGLGTFQGDVDLRSAGELMQCSTLKLNFQSDDQTARKERVKGRSLGLGLDTYSKRSLSSLEAIGGMGKTELALMRSTKFAPTNANWLQQRMELRGKTVFYEAASGNVRVTGKGTFLAEDYRKPMASKADPDPAAPVGAMSGASAQRPSQTVFSWTKSMALQQPQRTVTMEGSSTMVHRSGTNVREIPGIEHEPWGTLPTGRTSNMRSETMVASFAAAPKPAKPAAAPKKASGLEGGFSWGPLETFRANRDVTVTDGPYRVSGQRVDYSAKTQNLFIWGYLDGGEKTNARVSYENKATGQASNWESPTIRWNMKTNRIEVDAIRGGGGM
ncbi:MAG: hypothetical protein HN370_09325, partial [Phycisphaerales bacterium]|nr:hypothetical protein [Phycisphaerales bacterium]